MRERQLRFITGAGEDFGDPLEVMAANEDVEVFRMPLNPGVAREGVRAPDEVLDPRGIEAAECVTIKSAAVLVEDRRRCCVCHAAQQCKDSAYDGARLPVPSGLHRVVNGVSSFGGRWAVDRQLRAA